MKNILFLALIGVSTAAWAQKSALRDARDFLSENNYKRAVPLTNEAIKNAETKNDAEAWFLRGMAYLQWAVDASEHNSEAPQLAYASLTQALVLKQDYAAEINTPLYAVATLKFNNAVGFYQAKSFEQAYNDFMAVYAIYKTGNGKRFSENSEFRTLAASARINGAYAAMNAGNRNAAIVLLEELVKNEARDDSNAYQALIEMYIATKEDTKQIATIKAARSQFPNSTLFRNLELNYYITTGKGDELLPKLEAAVEKDPGNPELLFNLGNAYTKVAFPPGEAKSLTKRDNFPEVFAKAEKTYRKAVELVPDNADYNYNMGILYYNYASWYNVQMAAKDKNRPDDKQYEQLKAKRNEQFAKALPFFEKSYSVLDKKGGLNATEKDTHHSSMIALKEIYTRTGNSGQKAMIEKRLEGSK